MVRSETPADWPWLVVSMEFTRSSSIRLSGMQDPSRTEILWELAQRALPGVSEQDNPNQSRNLKGGMDF